MTENLGDRIRARRAHVQAHANNARDDAKHYAVALGNSLKQHLENYVDKRIAKLAADNNLTNNP